ncbi:hypothetical protein CCH79_00004474 [Gambusia affinis]|uniref:Ragulator complex protein LAMTOR3 n=2 Tax=Euteleostomi TaxID=117571 RepID=A0A315UYU2_GAMAF|nr:hypothetical protein CCH79_00004474 [Gambusia affinis]
MTQNPEGDIHLQSGSLTHMGQQCCSTEVHQEPSPPWSSVPHSQVSPKEASSRKLFQMERSPSDVSMRRHSPQPAERDRLSRATTRFTSTTESYRARKRQLEKKPGKIWNWAMEVQNGNNFSFSLLLMEDTKGVDSRKPRGAKLGQRFLQTRKVDSAFGQGLWSLTKIAHSINECWYLPCFELGITAVQDLKRYLYKQLQRLVVLENHSYQFGVSSKLLNQLFVLLSVEGLHAVVVTDRDGVPVIKVANDNAPVHALRPGFLSTFALATDQGSKLGLSKNKSIICYYNSYQIVQFNRLPLVISFIASSNANTGLIMSLEKELAPLIENLRQVVENKSKQSIFASFGMRLTGQTGQSSQQRHYCSSGDNSHPLHWTGGEPLQHAGTVRFHLNFCVCPLRRGQDTTSSPQGSSPGLSVQTGRLLGPVCFMFQRCILRGEGSESTDDVEERLGHLDCFDPEQVGGVAANHAEGTVEQHEAKIQDGTEQQHQHVNPRLQHTERTRCFDAAFVSLPTASVMTPILSRISWTTLLFWSGVDRQQMTALHLQLSSRKLAFSSSCRAHSNVRPSITRMKLLVLVKEDSSPSSSPKSMMTESAPLVYTTTCPVRGWRTTTDILFLLESKGRMWSSCTTREPIPGRSTSRLSAERPLRVQWYARAAWTRAASSGLSASYSSSSSLSSSDCTSLSRSTFCLAASPSPFKSLKFSRSSGLCLAAESSPSHLSGKSTLLFSVQVSWLVSRARSDPSMLLLVGVLKLKEPVFPRVNNLLSGGAKTIQFPHQLRIRDHVFRLSKNPAGATSSSVILKLNVNHDANHRLGVADGAAPQKKVAAVKANPSLTRVLAVCSFNVTDPTGVRGVQQQQVSRDDFITRQTDKVSDSHVTPAPVNVGLLLAVIILVCPPHPAEAQKPRKKVGLEELLAWMTRFNATPPQSKTKTVFRRANAVALVLLGHGFIFLLVGAVAGQHCPPLAAGPLRGAFARKAIRRRVPASLRVYGQKLPTAMSHPVKALHLSSPSCGRAPTPAWNSDFFLNSFNDVLLQTTVGQTEACCYIARTAAVNKANLRDLLVSPSWKPESRYPLFLLTYPAVCFHPWPDSTTAVGWIFLVTSLEFQPQQKT